jgi:hypothetical protein
VEKTLVQPTKKHRLTTAMHEFLCYNIVAARSDDDEERSDDNEEGEVVMMK